MRSMAIVVYGAKELKLSLSFIRADPQIVDYNDFMKCMNEYRDLGCG